MTEENIVSFIVLGFSISMLVYFFGQIPRLLMETVEIFTKR